MVLYDKVFPLPQPIAAYFKQFLETVLLSLKVPRSTILLTA